MNYTQASDFNISRKFSTNKCISWANTVNIYGKLNPEPIFNDCSLGPGRKCKVVNEKNQCVIPQAISICDFFNTHNDYNSWVLPTFSTFHNSYI